ARRRAPRPPGPRPTPPAPRPRRARSPGCSGPARRRSGRTPSARRPRRRAEPSRSSELAGPLAPLPLLDDPLVVLRELVDARHPADLGLGAREGRQPLGPLDRLLLRVDVEDVEPA